MSMSLAKSIFNNNKYNNYEINDSRIPKEHF
jgi:hypothetical protein